MTEPPRRYRRLRLDLEAARRRIDELEAEAREAEMVRRRLHNMVQELKGNIRVFARVRPLLPSDVSGTNDEKARNGGTGKYVVSGLERSSRDCAQLYK
jgi:hypothetical protein